MKTIYHKTKEGYAVVYPTKTIKERGTKVHGMVAGRGPITAHNPSSVVDQIFQISELGDEVESDNVPVKWRSPLGLPKLKRIKNSGVTEIVFIAPEFEYWAKPLCRFLIGFTVGCVIAYLLGY